MKVGGPHGEEFGFTEPIPSDASKAVMVAVTWNKAQAKLYLNGELAASKSI